MNQASIGQPTTTASARQVILRSTPRPLPVEDDDYIPSQVMVDIAAPPELVASWILQ